MPQGPGDLGQRMERVLQRALLTANIAIAVGTDIPGVGDAAAALAQEQLRTHDAVLGPCRDGGFYLLALKRCPQGLLHDLPWSCATTLEATRARLQEAGMSVALLEERFDVDDAADLRPLSQHLAAHPLTMPQTRRFLASEHNRAISVVVPVLNEAARLPAQLNSLRQLRGLAQIIVADGGSTDGSVELAEACAGVDVVHSAAGRGRQMNAGAAVAFGGTLLFVHADVELPGDACEQIHHALEQEQACAGAFRLRTRYDSQGRHRPWVAAFLPLADLRSKYTRFPYGDQALFVRAKTFRELGGYPELPLFEDLALARALHALGPLQRAPGPVLVSGRRFQDRPLYYLALMNSFPLLYRLGVSAERLARFYRDTR